MLAKQSATLVAFNAGGEAHTFTEVARFGGGFVVVLNQLSGNPVPAPECADPNSKPDAQGLLPPAKSALASFIPPGGHLSVDVPPIGKTELYQCCIHPWMRASITGRKG